MSEEKKFLIDVKIWEKAFIAAIPSALNGSWNDSEGNKITDISERMNLARRIATNAAIEHGEQFQPRLLEKQAREKKKKKLKKARRKNSLF